MSTLAVVDLCCLLDRSFNNLKATPLWLSYSAPSRANFFFGPTFDLDFRRIQG